ARAVPRCAPGAASTSRTITATAARAPPRAPRRRCVPAACAPRCVAPAKPCVPARAPTPRPTLPIAAAAQTRARAARCATRGDAPARQLVSHELVETRHDALEQRGGNRGAFVTESDDVDDVENRGAASDAPARVAECFGAFVARHLPRGARDLDRHRERQIPQ